MSAIKKMNQELEIILGREATIHEQIDILILSAIKERVLEYQLAYQMQPEDIQERNPEIFGGIDSDGGDYE